MCLVGLLVFHQESISHTRIWEIIMCLTIKQVFSSGSIESRKGISLLLVYLGII